MKVSLISTALVAALLIAAPVQRADAIDKKMYAGSGCKVFGSTAWTDLQFGAAGVTNLTAVAKNIICPIIKDTEASWDGGFTNPAAVHYHLRTGNNTQKSACHAYVANAAGTLLNTYSVVVGGIANTEYERDLFWFNDNGSTGDHVQATILCTLGAAARLNYYFVIEGAVTD